MSSDKEHSLIVTFDNVPQNTSTGTNGCLVKLYLKFLSTSCNESSVHISMNVA